MNLDVNWDEIKIIKDALELEILDLEQQIVDQQSREMKDLPRKKLANTVRLLERFE